MTPIAEETAHKAHNLSAVTAQDAEKEAQLPGTARRPTATSESAALTRPHPELAGKRLRLPGEPAIYLVDPEGFRHHIPDPYTYNRVFRDFNGVFDDPDLNDIPDGGPLSFGASVIRGDGFTAVYLVSQGEKRHVTSPAVMDKCNFRWPSGGDIVGPAVVTAIRTGPEWNVPVP